MKLVSKILLLNPEKKLLMALRDDKPEIPYPKHWGNVGGEIEQGESPLEALKREIKEEISCDIYDIKILGEAFDPEEDCKVIFFKGKVFERLENIKLYEGQKLDFFTFEEIKNLLIAPFVKKFILNNKNKIFD